MNSEPVNVSAKSDFFLTGFLKPVKNTAEHRAIRLSILFILKQIAPRRFQALQLDQSLEAVIAEIETAAQAPPSLRQRVTAIITGMVSKTKDFYGLQPKLDYWYYTKLLGYGDQYKVDDKKISKVITEEHIRNVADPKDAVLFYIYVRTLSYCDSERYGRLKKYIPHLRNIAQQDEHLYAYLLTHVILYDTRFGQQPASKSSFKALKELESFCENQLIFQRENVDLMSEIIICCKLCRAHDFPFYAKLLSNIMPTETFRHYHENAVLAVATLEWESA